MVKIVKPADHLLTRNSNYVIDDARQEDAATEVKAGLNAE
jgi:hypothetical protein